MNDMRQSVAMVLFAGCLAAGLSACNLDSKEPIPQLTRKVPITPLEGGEGKAFLEGSATQVAPPSQRVRQVEGSASDYAGHPKGDPNQKAVSRQVVVPPEVDGKWKAVKIMVRHKQDEEQNSMRTVDLGSSITLGGAGLQVAVGPFLPNFVMDDNTFTSNGNELKNPAVRLVVTQGGQTLFEGWMFAKYPALYGFEHDTYALQLMDFILEPVS